MEPRVTICMPAFNSAATLRRAVASVRAQTIGDWRLVISDDCSQDETWELARAVAAEDARIEAIRQPERRMFMNFATGLAGARTPFFVWLAPDDYWAPRFLEASLAALADAPRAVSALPMCRWIGHVDGPRTDTLDGPPAERLKRYLAAPGGTRMYGLARTEAVQAAFPGRNMNAYDWFLVTGLLRVGPQVEVPEMLLFRDRTDALRYAEIVDTMPGPLPFRRYPVLRMSLAALRAGHVPAASFGDLLALNLRKHEEYLAVTRPGQFARRLWLFRRLRLPISTWPGRAAEIAGRIARADPARRPGAGKVLRRLARLGDAKAALELGHLRAEGLLPGDAERAYARAGELGLPDGWFHAAIAAQKERDAPDAAGWARIVGAAHLGSGAARAHLERSGREGRLPPPLADVARHLHRTAPHMAEGRAAIPGTAPRLTAILTCRNAAPTLGALLAHLARQGAEAIVIDNGSTDATRAIAESHRGAPVVEIVDEPVTGVFDLTRQLRLKRDIIRGLDGWVLHADADEFVDGPDGWALRDLLALWDLSGILAFECDELLFLPRSDAEQHDPASFQTSMRHCHPLGEHDPKQRLFRASAPLDLWMRTGGHTITRDRPGIAPARLRLRHYFGLSLDQIRSEYLSRVFASRDVAKLWHGSRMGAAAYDIVPPSPAELCPVDAVTVPDAPPRRPAIFRPRAGGAAPVSPVAERFAAQADLAVLAAPGEAAGWVVGALSRLMPDLRVTRLSGIGGAGSPVLHLLSHPARDAPEKAEVQPGHAEEWLRRIAQARQAALIPGTHYLEARIEDLEEAPGCLPALVGRLLLGGGPRAADGFLGADLPLRRAAPYPARVRAIAGALARDLGYA
jgi:glycosyltransferase involved in cell wall biosynthesis